MWQKSKHSQGVSNCIEWQYFMSGDGILIRDSKDPDGPRLAFPTVAWTKFVKDVREHHW